MKLYKHCHPERSAIFRNERSNEVEGPCVLLVQACANTSSTCTSCKAPPAALSTWDDEQPAPPCLPAQNPPQRRLHRRLQRHPPGLLGKVRERRQGHRPRKAAKTLAPRKENVASGNDEPQVPEPSPRL